MLAMGDNDLMPFGKHKGKRLEDVPASHLAFSALCGEARDYMPRHKPRR